MAQLSQSSHNDRSILTHLSGINKKTQASRLLHGRSLRWNQRIEKYKLLHPAGVRLLFQDTRKIQVLLPSCGKMLCKGALTILMLIDNAPVALRYRRSPCEVAYLIGWRALAAAAALRSHNWGRPCMDDFNQKHSECVQFFPSDAFYLQ